MDGASDRPDCLKYQRAAPSNNSVLRRRLMRIRSNKRLSQNPERLRSDERWSSFARAPNIDFPPPGLVPVRLR